jgi:hypothetical protein
MTELRYCQDNYTKFNKLKRFSYFLIWQTVLLEFILSLKIGLFYLKRKILQESKKTRRISIIMTFTFRLKRKI